MNVPPGDGGSAGGTTSRESPPGVGRHANALGPPEEDGMCARWWAVAGPDKGVIYHACVRTDDHDVCRCDCDQVKRREATHE